MLTIAQISCISFFLIRLIVYEICQVATLPAWPHYPSFPYALTVSYHIYINEFNVIMYNALPIIEVLFTVL